MLFSLKCLVIKPTSHFKKKKIKYCIWAAFTNGLITVAYILIKTIYTKNCKNDEIKSRLYYKDLVVKSATQHGTFLFGLLTSAGKVGQWLSNDHSMLLYT